MKSNIALILLLASLAHMSAGTVSEGDEATAEDLLMNLRNALETAKREETDAAVQEADEQLGERGAWDDFKASMKKAGQKVKNAFGKRVEEEKEEKEEEEVTLRGAWDDFKASMKKAGQKVKNAFGKRVSENEEKKEEEVTLRGAWDDFKQSVSNAGTKIKNAFGKKALERRTSEGYFMGNGFDLEAYKEEISKWKQMVAQLGIQNDPEIKKMEAELDALWQQLGLDNVDVPARQMVYPDASMSRYSGPENFGEEKFMHQLKPVEHYRGDPHDLKAYKEEIIKWKQIIEDFVTEVLKQLGMQNDPDVKQVLAELDAIFEFLGFDKVR